MVRSNEGVEIGPNQRITARPYGPVQVDTINKTCAHVDHPLNPCVMESDMTLPLPDVTSLDARFPPIEFGFDLREDPEFEPPPGVVALRGKGRVHLRVAVGAHYFFTCLAEREPDFATVTEFMNSTLDPSSPHRFRGRNFSHDKEWNGATSSRYAKLIGIAFMAEHAGSTWFAPIDWAHELECTDGTMCFRKQDPDGDGPDYLAAPFDPVGSGTPDPFYVLEFKGRKQQVTFKSPDFDRWRAQATNIDCVDENGTHRTVKSWVLAFNYAFEQGVGGRTCSTLLVDDPEAGRPDAPPIEPTRESIAPIIRAHLARQCRKLGAGNLIGAVLGGRLPERSPALPRTYFIDHPKLGGRRYIGWFGSWGPSGEVLWSSNPGSRAPGSAFDGLYIDVNLEGPTFRGHAHARVRGRGPRKPSLDVFVHGQTPWPGSRQEIEAWLEQLLGRGPGGEFFIGQDATMLRECMHTQLGRALTGVPFVDPIELFESARGEDAPHAIQVIRNGSALASSRAVRPAEDDHEWWLSSPRND